MTVEIPLAGGLVALVDDDDLELVNQYRWYAMRGGRPGSGVWYANRSLGGRRGSQLMHQLLTGWSLTDHRNGNGLDNRRANLRQASREENARNSRKRRGTRSRYKGVIWKKNKWEVQIYISTRDAYGQLNCRKVYLGRFTSETRAAHAYDDAARQHFGEFAALNFPTGNERAAVWVSDGQTMVHQGSGKGSGG